MKTTTITATLNVPFVESFDDYHDTDWKKETLKSAGFNVKVKEIAFNGLYWAIFYVGKLPTKEEIIELLKDVGIDYGEVNFGFRLKNYLTFL